MVFKKKWTDEQDEELLELHKRISNKEIAKKFNISAVNVSKRVSFLKKKNKAKPKAKPKATEDSIEVLTAKPHANADELAEEYKPEQIEQAEATEEEATEEEETEEETSEENQDGIKVDWSGLAGTITEIIDQRFITNELKPLSQSEKELFSKALNQTLEIRAQFIMKHGDLVNLGIATFSLFTPRIMEFFKRKKEIEAPATIDLPTENVQEEAPQEVVSDEEAKLKEAQARFEAMTPKQ